MSTIPASPAVVRDGESMGAAATPEGNAAAAAVAELTSRLTLDADGGVYRCKNCSTPLGLAADIISKAFLCSTGRAYLFDTVANVTLGEKEERMMITGLYSISDVFCGGCQETVGWKYELAYERSQKYKEGKFILQR
ncbi:hypothetical protein BS78_01G116400 [Paspalum vaginatum]|nr:hypothetical protein BS78_01G116400 [Paspalum vaginatum]